MTYLHCGQLNGIVILYMIFNQLLIVLYRVELSVGRQFDWFSRVLFARSSLEITSGYLIPNAYLASCLYASWHPILF